MKCSFYFIELLTAIFETPSHNCGIRGLPGDELSLDYNIKI
ncbi:hypothetical protein [Clostridium kluyveri]|nr:hypothetical protein [Clostridium kluyveri]UZQ48740.1 hypothetical protein OP486_12165 [Clostridium kluyveri]